MDQKANFVISTVVGAYTASATSIQVANILRFPNPASGQYDITWWNSTDYENASEDPNREIVRVVGRNTETSTLTIQRARQGTLASPKNISFKVYKVAQAVYQKDFDDLQALAEGDVSGPESSTDDNIAVFDGITGKLIKDGGKTILSLETDIGNKADDPHDLGGASHSADTLANLNSKISDANLDDSGDTRPPASHNNTAHSKTFATTDEAETLTNKRNQPRVFTTTSTASLTPDLSAYNVYIITAQAEALTIAAPTGTPTLGETIHIMITAVTSNRTITYNAVYKAMGEALKTTATVAKTLEIIATYDGANWLSSSVEMV
jgi:hypothetical protein